MRTNEIIKEIQPLPISKRIYVLEKTIHSLRRQEEKSQMEKAADLLLDDYQSYPELTIFTNLEFDNFYETK